MNLRELEAADTESNQNTIRTVECEDQNSKGAKDYQASLSTTDTDQRSKDSTAHSHSAVKEGRWFETPRGSLKRIEEQEKVGDNFGAIKEGWWFETARGSLKRIEKQEKVNDDLDDDTSISPPVSSFSENSPNSSKSSVASREDEHFSGVRLPISLDNQNEAVNVSQIPKEGEIVDSGHFALGDICVVLGNGSLDEQRLMKLKAGFMALLDDTVGVYRG